MMEESEILYEEERERREVNDEKRKRWGARKGKRGMVTGGRISFMDKRECSNRGRSKNVKRRTRLVYRRRDHKL